MSVNSMENEWTRRGVLEICGKRKFHATTIANLVFVLIFCIVVSYHYSKVKGTKSHATVCIFGCNLVALSELNTIIQWKWALGSLEV